MISRERDDDEWLLTRRTKDKDFPGELQAIVVAVQNGYCGCEELGQVSDELRCLQCLQCHDDRQKESDAARVWASPFGRFTRPSSPDRALPTQLALLLTMSLVARTSALRRQIVHSRAFVPSRGVHGYKVCALKF